MATIWIMLTVSDGSIIRIFTIRSTGIAGITIRTPIHPGIHPIGRWAGDTVVGIHLITVGDGVIRPITVTGITLIILIMDTVIPIIRGMVMADIMVVTMEILDTTPILITEKGDRPGRMLYMAKMQPEGIQEVWLPEVMDEIKAGHPVIPLRI